MTSSLRHNYVIPSFRTVQKMAIAIAMQKINHQIRCHRMDQNEKQIPNRHPMWNRRPVWPLVHLALNQRPIVDLSIGNSLYLIISKLKTGNYTITRNVMTSSRRFFWVGYCYWRVTVRGGSTSDCHPINQ